MLVRFQPPELLQNASVVKRTSRDSPKVEVQVRFLVEALGRLATEQRPRITIIPGVWRRHAALRRRRLQVRLLPGILWPNPKRLRDPAVNRGCVGSTPTGHPERGARGEGRGAREDNASAARWAERRSRKADGVGSTPTAGSYWPLITGHWPTL